MKTKIYFVHFLLLTFISLLSCKTQNKDESMTDVPKEAIKCIITASYEPLLYNSEWICGKEISNDEKYGRDTIYYDEFNNELLVKNNTHLIKRIFYSPKEKKLKTEYTISRNNSKNGIKKDYIRNKDGNWTEINSEIIGDSEKSVSQIFTAKYDNQGVRVEDTDLEKAYRTVYKKNPSNNKIIIETYQILTQDKTHYYNGMKGLYEYGMSIKDTKTKLIKKDYVENYLYGGISGTSETFYSYDINNKLIQKEISKKNVLFGAEYPMGADEATITRLQENYYQSGYLKYYKIKISIQYNKSGEEELHKFYSMRQDEDEFSLDSKFSHRFIFEYNQKGDWVKRTTYPILAPKKKIEKNSSSFSSLRNFVYDDEVINPNTPTEITIRQIEYLKH